MDKAEMLAQMDPQLRPCYEAMQPYSMEYGTLCGIRAYTLAQLRQSPSPFEGREDIRLYIRTVPGPAGAPEVPIRIYEPTARTEWMPIILYFHGGGGVLSSARQDDPFCLELALRERCVVVSVDYRLAPEHPAPAGQLDCLAAWRWLCSQGAGELKLDLNCSVFYGGSGGGNMALGAALRLLDGGEGLPSLLMPLYPMIDPRGETPSSREITDESLWGRRQNLQAWAYYLHGLDGERTGKADTYTAPIFREEFGGLPPVFTFVGQLDQFRDETLALAAQLSRCGVPVEFTLYPGCFHGFEVSVPDAAVSRCARRRIHERLQMTFYPQADPAS